MKLKLLLLFLCVVGYGAVIKAQTKKPYNNLLITEVRLNGTPQNYVEFTNMGNETIDLSNFEFGTIGPWTNPFIPGVDSHLRLPKKDLAPGKSFVIAVGSDFEPENWLIDPLHNAERVTKPEMYKIADIILHRRENKSNANDSITPKWQTMDTWNGRDCYYLRHHYLTAEGVKDSMIIDQVGGIFDEDNGTSQDKAHDVAGVTNATNNSILIRRSSITAGVQEFSTTEANAEAAKLQFSEAKGLDLNDSEWIPVPTLGPNEEWRAVFWTTGNHGNNVLNANTLVSKTGKVKVDLTAGTITVPWGVRRLDSLMYQFERRPGLAWDYDYAPTVEDSAYRTVRTGDKLTLYVCGDVATVKEFNLIAEAPTASDNIVIMKNGYDYTRKMFSQWVNSYSGYRITDGVPGIDTITHIDYATRVDTLLKYLEKAPKASWEIVFHDGVKRPDLKKGDKLRVTSENGKVKEYYLKVDKFVPSANSYLASITWPDIPSYFKGDVAGSYGWKSDTIPGFAPSKSDYVVMIPLEYKGIPGLVYHKQQTDSKVEVTRVKSMEGDAADRTLTFTVTAEDDSTQTVYTVRFEREKDYSNVQAYTGEPFFSQYIFWEQWSNSYLEIANPGTEPLDLSHYMIASGWGGPEGVFFYGSGNGVNDWRDAYARYVPGKKWVDEASWAVQSSMMEPDMATNAIVYPGDVFVIAHIQSVGQNSKGNGDGDSEVRDQIDIDFKRNPWGRKVHDNTAVHCWSNATIYMWKILNDSVYNGLKPANDPLDFELIETWGSGSAQTEVKLGGRTQGMIQSNFRKPEIYKPNPEVGGSNGATPEESEWYYTDQNYYIKLNYGWPAQILRVCDGIGSHNMYEVTIQKSTVTSKIYKVTPGYTDTETIRGLKTGTTVSGFYDNIIKANALQTLTVKSAATGAELGAADAISNGDFLVVLSGDSTNTTQYTLDVSTNGLPTNAVLTSTQYTIGVTGATGTISGFAKSTPLKTVFEGVVIPAGATLTITDANDAYMSLVKLNYDTMYVDVVATDKVYFEVVAEDGITKIVYNLKPTSLSTDAYVTSDVYSVDQFGSLIQFVPGGTTGTSLLSNLATAPGATMKIYDKAGFERTAGDVYRDDKLVVTSADGTVSKAYYFSMLNFFANEYFAFVISDDYAINQVRYIINGASLSTGVGEFISKMYPSFGANIKVMSEAGVERTSGNLTKGDVLLVTAADGITSNTYKIENVTGINNAVSTSNIKMYPNPTNGRVVVQGLTKGNRLRVLNSAGITLRDVVVENVTENVSLDAQPAGIYIFVISAGTQHINIQKIVKK